MKLRSMLYKSARIIGDVEAVTKSVERKSTKPVVGRVRRRLIGRALSRFIR